MPNVASLLKAEIIRLARKEVRGEVAAMRKASATHRRQLAALKRDVAALQGKAKALAKQAKRQAENPEPATKVRFQAKGLRSMRAKLGLSAADLATLIGVSQQSVYNWEREKSAPRASQVAAIAALRGVGKREALQKLQASSASNRRRT